MSKGAVVFSTAATHGTLIALGGTVLESRRDRLAFESRIRPERGAGTRSRDWPVVADVPLEGPR